MNREMKKIICIVVFLLPLLASAQFDFDTRYFTINATSLPDVPQINEDFQVKRSPSEKAGTFTLENTPTFAATLNAIKISATNYWEPVNMMDAVTVSTNYLDKTLSIAPVDSNRFGFSGYTSDASSKVKNTVYSEVRGLDILDPCPPFGICPRCAPYRFRRGY
ncbi:hypothetical protein SAMN05421855_104144 [Ulvibacter litoralis]|uniref:Uncharacterized protein n=2 Tax=Ulvibacter litoralis TaxID=227084 RepID=A0A1G7HKF5_9FLAO|nr:hypothetical protein GCM10008083_23550 [Ulvibacter litoralis]SDF00853.1 hypothetical protein SAMN05421855_104144 [Ulvibacter litoralis]